MSFPRYPAYKPSGVEWLGEVPEHWEFKKLKHCILRLGSGGTPESSNPEFWADDDSEDSIPWVAIGDMSAVSRVTSTAKSLTPFGLSSKNLEIFPSGSLLYSIYASLGKVAILGMDAAFNQAILAILPNTQCVSQPFLRCWLESLERHLEYYASSNTQANLNAAKVLSYPVSVPSLPEQRAIATFLDRETAKIDALIAEQQRLIELLQEKRQAVISHAVTKGLHPDAPMKDSGVEWLGEVPEHWTVMPLRLAARIESGHTPSRSHEEYWIEKDCVYPWFTLGDVWQIRDGKAEYVFETQEKVSQVGLDNSAARMLPANTVILSRTASVGFSGILGVPMATTQDFVNWVCGPKIAPEFLLFVFRAMSKEFERLKYGSTHNTIYMPDIFSFRVALPSLIEQGEIVSSVRESLRRLDGSLDDLLSSKELLQERRSALISAAVTGQIDVRGLVPEASTA
jgi:type I restriction enzyme S subunit